MLNKLQFSIDFPSSDMSVRNALEQIKQSLSPLDLSMDDMASVEVVLGEVLNNVVEHAYGQSLDGAIVLSCVRKNHMLRFCVEDEGKSLPNGRLPMGDLPNLDVPLQAIPEGGFGWYLVRNLSFDLSYKRIGQRNVLAFSIPFEGNG